MIPFLPARVEELPRLKNLFDDDLDVSAFAAEPIQVPRGQTLIWDHIYQQGSPGYKVLSADRADIELLKLYGQGHGARLRSQLSLFFEDARFRTYEWTTEWHEGDHVIASGNDLLGPLQGETVVWFRLAVTPIGGTGIEVERIDFFWEVADLEKADCGLHDILQIEGVGEVYAKRLRALGIGTVEQLLHHGRLPKERQQLAERGEFSLKRLEHWVDMAELFRIRGVGEEYSELLDQSGVDSLPKLAACDSQRLHRDLVETNRKRNLVRQLPSQVDVTRWIIQAKSLEPLVVHEPAQV